MNLALWIVQILLAILFLAAGIPKALQPVDALAKRMAWVSSTSPGLVRFIGVSELLGAIGLVLPGVAQFAPWLTVLAATGFAVIMLLAISLHVRRHEMSVVPMNVVLLALALFVAIGRIGTPV